MEALGTEIESITAIYGDEISALQLTDSFFELSVLVKDDGLVGSHSVSPFNLFETFSIDVHWTG